MEKIKKTIDLGKAIKGYGKAFLEGRKELLKKSKKFPGPGSEKQLGKKIETRIRHGKPVPGKKGNIGQGDIDVDARIKRTGRYRNIRASQLVEMRKGKK
jgi:hypothetical protein